MAEYLGRSIAVGIAYEGTRGTAAAAPEYWLRLLAQNHKDKVEYLSSQAAIGTIVETNNAEIDKQWSEGGFDAEIDADSMGLMFLALLGEVDSAVVDADDAYLHTFTLEESANHQSLTIFTSEPGRDTAYPLSCIDTLSFNFERGKILDFSSNLMGSAGESDTLTPAFATAKSFRPKDFHIYLADDIDGLDAADEVFLKTMTLEFAKNLEPDDVLGLVSPQNFLNKVFSTTAKFSLLYNDETYRALFLAGTPKAVRIKLENDSVPLVAAVAATGTLTVVDYTGLTGDTIAIGGVTLTEGVDFDAETSNDITATNIAAAIHALAAVDAAAVGAVVTVTAATAGTAGNAITMTTSGGADLTLSAATLTNGAEAINPYIIFDFARVYFSGYEEGNDRDSIKTQEITMIFAINPEEADITFGEIRVMNAVDLYIPA